LGYLIALLGPGAKALREAASRFRRGVGREGAVKVEREALLQHRQR
jgi:hypothetical protein